MGREHGQKREREKEEEDEGKVEEEDEKQEDGDANDEAQCLTVSLFCFLGFVWGGWRLIAGDITSCCHLPASRLSCHRLDSHNGSVAFAMSLNTKGLIVA